MRKNNVALVVKQLRFHMRNMIPYKSYLKILNRLQDKNILTLVSKGVNLIGEGDVDIGC